MSKEIEKEYTNGELTIVWKPGKCIHAGECVKALPKVYNPKDKPWLKIENASTEELMAQVKKCPSGALTFYKNEEGNSVESSNQETECEVMKDGPLLVHGRILVKSTDGQEEAKSKTTAFCRCGASNNKPYCDGSHAAIKFKG